MDALTPVVPSAPAPAEPSSAAGSPPVEPADSPRGADRAAALARKLRKAEKELASFRDAEQARQSASMSEADKHKQTTEQIKSENQTLRDELKSFKMRSAYEKAAAKAGVPSSHLEAAMKLADLSEADLDDPTTFADILAAQKTSFPFLFGAPSTPAPDIGGGGGNPRNGGPVTMSPEKIKAMTSSEFAALQDDIKAGRVKL